MPFDGTSRDATVITMLDALLEHYRCHNKEECIGIGAWLHRELREVRIRRNIRGDKTRFYILAAVKHPDYCNITLSDLNWLTTDFSALENILLRARDLASGEPMREATWEPKPTVRICNCTPGRASFLTGHLPGTRPAG